MDARSPSLRQAHPRQGVAELLVQELTYTMGGKLIGDLRPCTVTVGRGRAGQMHGMTAHIATRRLVQIDPIAIGIAEPLSNSEMLIWVAFTFIYTAHKNTIVPTGYSGFYCYVLLKNNQIA